MARNDFELSNVVVKLDNYPDTKISVRKAVNKVSMTGGQGFVRCNCTTKCKRKTCTCKKLGVLCNSRCHNSSSCANK